LSTSLRFFISALLYTSSEYIEFCVLFVVLVLFSLSLSLSLSVEAAVRAGFSPDALTWMEMRHFVYRDTNTETIATQVQRHLKIRNFILGLWKSRPTRYLSLATVLKRARNKMFQQHPQHVAQIYEFLVRHGHINVGYFSYDTSTSASASTSNRETQQQREKSDDISPPPSTKRLSTSLSLSL
jgi:hypothetical protein